jgi:hypothetical protein
VNNEAARHGQRPNRGAYPRAGRSPQLGRRYDPGIDEGQTEKSDERLGTLRGAGINVDARRVGRFIVRAGLVALAAVVVILFLAGSNKNSEISRLRTDGVPVQIKISSCLGLLGGSGSNAAGYSCRGSFTSDGHRYNEVIPGNTLHPPGTILKGVTVPGDPQLVETAARLTAERTSSRVYLLPSVLLVVLVLGGLLVRRRRTGPAGNGATPPGTEPTEGG